MDLKWLQITKHIRTCPFCIHATQYGVCILKIYTWIWSIIKHNCVIVLFYFDVLLVTICLFVFWYLRRCFLSSIIDHTFTDLTMGTIVSYKMTITLCEHMDLSPAFWRGPCCSSFYLSAFFVSVLCLVPNVALSLKYPFLPIQFCLTFIYAGVLSVTIM